MNFLSKGNLFNLHKSTIPKQDRKDLEFFKKEKKTTPQNIISHNLSGPFYCFLL